MLTQIGTVQAVRELIDVYVRFGEFLRMDTQLQLEKLDDKAVGALIEARRHQARKIARWAERQLDMLGKAIASEAVQTEDQEVSRRRAQAYGRTSGSRCGAYRHLLREQRTRADPTKQRDSRGVDGGSGERGSSAIATRRSSATSHPEWTPERTGPRAVR